jgi:transposase-like protein
VIVDIASADGFAPEVPLKGHGEKYSRQKEQAIAALLRCPIREKAAQEVGISTKTLQRWLKVPEFAEAYRQARLEESSRLLSQLLQASSLALGTLMQVANDSQAPAAAQVRAAQSLLKFSGQAMELEDVQMRLQRWEQQQPNPPSSAAPPLPVERTGRSPRGHGAKFDRTKEKAIAALLSQPTVDRAAQAADINTKTLQRWMRIPQFDQEYRKAYWDMFSQLTAQFQNVRPFALSRLRNRMTDLSAPATTRVSAAAAVLQFTAETLADAENLLLRVQRLVQQPPQPIRRTPPAVPPDGVSQQCDRQAS